jgi:hypothetical protein
MGRMKRLVWCIHVGYELPFRVSNLVTRKSRLVTAAFNARS